MMVKLLRHDLQVLAGVLLLASVLGLVSSLALGRSVDFAYRGKSERMEDSVKRLTEKVHGQETPRISVSKRVSLEEFSDYVSNREGLIFDARPEIFFRMGHVPNALSLPREDFESRYKDIKGRLESNRTQPMIIYCSGPSCDDAKLVERSLIELGYQNVGIFVGGWDAWKQSGQIIEGGE